MTYFPKMYPSSERVYRLTARDTDKPLVAIPPDRPTASEYYDMRSVALQMYRDVWNEAENNPEAYRLKEKWLSRWPWLEDDYDDG